MPRHNPEKKEFRGRSYKKGGARIDDLREKGELIQWQPAEHLRKQIEYHTQAFERYWEDRRASLGTAAYTEQELDLIKIMARHAWQAGYIEATVTRQVDTVSVETP